MKLLDMMRAQHTMRWTIVPTVRPQSVAEHSFNVAIIAERIAVLSGMSLDLAKLRSASLLHDIAEVVTGDLPTPTKSRMRDLGFDPNRMDDTITKSELLPTQYRVIIKAADLMESIHFLTNFGCSKRTEKVLSNLKDSYSTFIINIGNEINQPKVGIHWDRLAVAIGAAYDELMAEEGWTE